MMRDMPFHELRVDGNAVPCRPTLDECQDSPTVLNQALMMWGTSNDMARRYVPADTFLDNANEDMRMDQMMGEYYLDITDLIRRIKESGG
jgi:hypothetical protein